MLASAYALGWSLFALFLITVIICALAARREKALQKDPNQQAGGYGLTPRAAEYRLLWSKQSLATVDARCKEIAKGMGVDVIDDKMMKQAILEVVHSEWVKLSSRR
ncbi:MAG: hypothetical protein Q8L24_00685 [bacterium]|nr:hypothetical protein [bacterium]